MLDAFSGPDSWLDVARQRLRETRCLWAGTTLLLPVLRDLLAGLSDELRRELADEPCPCRAPAAYAEWRADVRDLHAARRLVRATIAAQREVPSVSTPAILRRDAAAAQAITEHMRAEADVLAARWPNRADADARLAEMERGA